MAIVVYLLCTLTALACALLLARGYARTRASLLFWSALCFAGLTINNALVFVDLIVVPEVSLFTVRNVTGLASVMVLIVGLVRQGSPAR